MRIGLASAIVAAGIAAPAWAQSSRMQGPTFLPGDVPKETRPPETPSTPKQSEQSGNACAAAVSENNGIVTLAIDDAARSDRSTTFTLDDRAFAARFDHAGHLQAEAPLLHSLGELSWEGNDGSKCYRHGVVFTNYQSAFEIALVSDAGAGALALHIVEPGGRVGGSQFYVSPDRPNLDGSYALGRMQTFGEAVPGTSLVQLYSLLPNRSLGGETVYAFVEFAARGSPARPPYCGEDPRAVASYVIIRLQDGSAGRQKGKFGAVACGTAWTGGPEESGYYQMWKYR